MFFFLNSEVYSIVCMAITMFPSHRQICEIVELKKALQILIQCFCLFFLLFITPLFIFFF